MIDMATDDNIDPNNLTVQDIDRLIDQAEERKRLLIAARKHLVVVDTARQAAAREVHSAIGGAIIPFPAPGARKRRGRVVGVVTSEAPMATNAFMPKPGTLDEKIFECLLALPLTAEKLAEKLGEKPDAIAKRMNDLEIDKFAGHFDIERRKATKHKGVSTPTVERYYFWRPRSELAQYRRQIITGLLMRKWWSNHDLILAAMARTPSEKRDVDNMVRTLLRAENVWHQKNEEGRWSYWMREDRGEPPPEMDGRDWGPKSKHARRGKRPPSATLPQRKAGNGDED